MSEPHNPSPDSHLPTPASTAHSSGTAPPDDDREQGREGRTGARRAKVYFYGKDGYAEQPQAGRKFPFRRILLVAFPPLFFLGVAFLAVVAVSVTVAMFAFQALARAAPLLIVIGFAYWLFMT